MHTLSGPALRDPGPGTDARSFSTWLQPHWPGMAWLARRSADESDWEDVLQEALSAAWRKRGQFDGARGSARNWLLAIVADQCAKNRRRLRPVLLAEPAQRPAVDADRTEQVDVDAALAKLTDRQRLAVNLRYFLELPVADVAQVLGCSEGTAKSTLSDARRQLRKLLGEDYR
ncbi:MAG TPA: RNA polymerase sigma factor [Jatrophihabitans sp.]|nr:RNA polymerase sigma factor [Jatrophihabitans sp.]